MKKLGPLATHWAHSHFVGFVMGWLINDECLGKTPISFHIHVVCKKLHRWMTMPIHTVWSVFTVPMKMLWVFCNSQITWQIFQYECTDEGLGTHHLVVFAVSGFIFNSHSVIIVEVKHLNSLSFLSDHYLYCLDNWTSSREILSLGLGSGKTQTGLHSYRD